MAPRSTSAGRPEAPNSAASPEGSRPRPSSAGSAGPIRACLLDATTSALESRKTLAPAAWAARGPTQTATGTLASATTRWTSAGSVPSPPKPSSWTRKARMPLDVLDRARLLVVTGKGGTGKTTVAAALAVAAARRGRRTLVAEVEGRQGLSTLFGRPMPAHQETRLAERVNGLAVDPAASLREYLGRYGFAPLARLLSWARLTTFVTAAAPGLGDILLVGKVWEAATRRTRDGRVYDLVVLDAPPTGRVVPFLRAPETVA